MTFICNGCRRNLPVFMPGVVVCVCGHKHVADVSYLQIKGTSQCVHIGDVVGVSDCGCEGSPKVFACQLHGLAMARKLKPGAVRVDIDGNKSFVEMAYCSTCPQELRIPRTKPVNGSAVITTHYNPAGFARLEETLREWLPTMPDGVIVERGNATADNAMWQKERLINRAIERLSADVRYVCWIDHDICFERDDWLIEACRLIDSGVDAVQPFETIKYSDRMGQVARTARGAASVVIRGGSPDTGPGGCWVASREWLDRIGGLYDRNIVGGGDATFFEAVSGQRTKYSERQSEASQRHLREWVESVGAVRIGYLPGAVRHLWHGDSSNRQYVSRDAILRRWEFDPLVHVQIDASGLLAWTDTAPQGLRDEVAAYFAARREDG